MRIYFFTSRRNFKKIVINLKFLITLSFALRHGNSVLSSIRTVIFETTAASCLFTVAISDENQNCAFFLRKLINLKNFSKYWTNRLILYRKQCKIFVEQHDCQESEVLLRGERKSANKSGQKVEITCDQAFSKSCIS